MSIKKKVAAIVLALFLIALVYSYFEQPSINTQEVHYSEYQNQVPFKGTYFTQEFVVYRGSVNKGGLAIKDGDKVPRGMRLYQNVLSIQSGVVMTHLDGYEAEFNISNIFKYDYKALNKISGTRKAGIKIVNNSEWYIYAAVNADEVFKPSRSYNLVFDNNTYPAEVVKTMGDTKHNYIVFRIKNDLNILDLHRNINGYIIKSVYNGVVIPEKALTSSNNTYGVLIKAHGYAEFRKVDLLFKGDSIAVINPSETGKTIQEYDELITNAENLKDGTKIR